MNNDQQNQKFKAAQDSYETSANVYQFISTKRKDTALKALFGSAACLGVIVLAPATTMIPALAINATFAYLAWKMRADNMRLSSIFNEVTQDMAPDAHSYLQPIAKELKKVEPIDFKDLNPITTFKKGDVFPLMMMGFSLLFAPTLLPTAAAMNISSRDKSTLNDTQKAALEVKGEIERIYPQLKTPKAGS
ncbi:MAG: hypothetical protein H6867_06595 [Rhodospirillales bacterium]|nr:hypothetical protein [Rhodospirillales bacterium]MCB9995217.1 hypothetical protein [Rhodospirillales bacterium]